jgi:O-antigen biosynthesis protein
MPQVTIVMATYNQATYMEEALDSIRSQTFDDFELIIVNDGCTDETPTILRRYQTNWPFILIDQDNQGQARSLNNGFAVAQGEYLTWTSSDNILLPTMLETLVDVLDKKPEIGLAYSDWNIIDSRGKITHRVYSLPFNRRALFRDNYINASFLYRRSLHEQIGEYDVTIGKKFDWDYWMKLSLVSTFQHVPQVVYHYRRHRASSHLQPDAQKHQNHFASVWKRREPINWYTAKLYAFLERKLNGRETWLHTQPVSPA